MSYGNSQTTRRPGIGGAKKGGGLFFIILLVGGYLLFSGMLNNGNQQGAKPAGKQNNLPRDRTDSNATENQNDNKNSGSIFATDVAKGKESTVKKDKPKKTQSGDWSMDEVETEKSLDNSSVQLVIPKEKPKKTESGDWSMEEVDDDK